MKKPNFIKRIELATSLLWGSPWEAANPSPNRAQNFGSAPVDFHEELTPFTRCELVDRMRSLTKNSGFVREYQRTMALYSAPVTPQSMVEDHEWAKEAEELYAARRRVADVTGRFSGNQIQAFSSKSIDGDGELFIIKTLDPVTRLPLLQLIETHRVGDFGMNDTIDGIKVDKQGKPIAIRVLLDNGKSKLVPMQYVMHLYDPESPSAYRHAPTMAHSINHRLDVEELFAIEKKGVKDTLDKTFIWKLLGGGDMDDEDLASMVGGTQSAEAERTNPQAAGRIIGGKNIIAQPGESVEAITSQRPNPTFTGFIDALDRESALGALAYEFFVNPGGLNGQAARIVIARVQRVVQRRSDVILERYLRPDWFFVIGNAIDNGELAPVKNWHKITGGYPKQVTIDAGRNDASIRENIAMGLTPPSEAFAEKGLGFAEAMERKAQDLATLAAIAKRHNLDPDQLFKFEKAPTGGAPNNSGTPPSAKPAK